jgi:hypothetical protein
MDPGKILSYGAIGLGFLLAFLAYRLLASEQKRDTPRAPMVHAIYTFMLFAFLLSILGFGGEYLKNQASQPSRAVPKRVVISLLEARPKKTTMGDAAASLSEIDNILTGTVATAIERKCFSTPIDREFHGTISALIYGGSGGYANNESFSDTNFEENAKGCIGTIFRGISFPEPLSKNPNETFESEYWITAKIDVTPSAQR